VLKILRKLDFPPDNHSPPSELSMSPPFGFDHSQKGGSSLMGPLLLKPTFSRACIPASWVQTFQPDRTSFCRNPSSIGAATQLRNLPKEDETAAFSLTPPLLSNSSDPAGWCFWDMQLAAGKSHLYPFKTRYTRAFLTRLDGASF